MAKIKKVEEVRRACAVYGVDPGHEGGLVRWTWNDAWMPFNKWPMGGKAGVRTDRAVRDEVLYWIGRDKWRASTHAGFVVRAVVEWPTTVAAMSSRRSMLGQGEGVGWVAGFLQGAGLEVWYVEPQVWRAAVGVQTPERAAMKALTKKEKEALGDGLEAVNKARRTARAKEAKTLLLEAGMAKLREVVPGWSVDHEGVIDAALIGLADVLTTSRVGWRRL